jgi:hypothetical protein
MCMFSGCKLDPEDDVCRVHKASTLPRSYWTFAAARKLAKQAPSPKAKLVIVVIHRVGTRLGGDDVVPPLLMLILYAVTQTAYQNILEVETAASAILIDTKTEYKPLCLRVNPTTTKTASARY